MKFAFIALLQTLVEVACHFSEPDIYSEKSIFKPYDDYPQQKQPRGRPWSDEIYPRSRERPFRGPPVYEQLGPALFPQADQLAFPPGGPSVLAPKGPQSFKVGSSINFGGAQSGKVGSFGNAFGSSSFQGSTDAFGGGPFGTGGSQGANAFGSGFSGGFAPGEGSFGTGGTQGTNAFGSGFSGGFGPGASVEGSFQGVLDQERPFQQDGIPFGNIGSTGSFGNIDGQNLAGGSLTGQFGGAGFAGFPPTKYETALAKNPLFLVLKLLITDPGLWVTSPVLYHGLAHTGIVKPFPSGFGIYGYRFANNVPDSQAYGSSNILVDKP